MGRMIGIDLGTTNSCAAVMEGGAPQVIPNQEGTCTTPSIVGFTETGECLVGAPARRQAFLNPRNTVTTVKHLIGRKADSVEAEWARQNLRFGLVPASNGDIHIEAGGRIHSPAEISALVLGKLKAAAEEYLGAPVPGAVIAVPAHFNDAQREATRSAGHLAGFGVCRLIDEAAAAALAYGLLSPVPEGLTVAVYDLGGGSFDITILEMAQGIFRVHATGGDTWVGGEDFDQRIIDWLVQDYWHATGVDLGQDRASLQRMKDAAERSRCELSRVESVRIALPQVPADAPAGRYLDVVLTREHFESLTRDLLEKTVEPCRTCLADAGLTPDEVDEVLLVGGPTRAPGVTALVRRIFGRDPQQGVSANEGVARGAAIRAEALEQG
jgi:molecular chaperone DnaK